jgi:hypothetical protein
MTIHVVYEPIGLEFEQFPGGIFRLVGNGEFLGLDRLTRECRYTNMCRRSTSQADNLPQTLDNDFSSFLFCFSGTQVIGKHRSKVCISKKIVDLVF